MLKKSALFGAVGTALLLSACAGGQPKTFGGPLSDTVAMQGNQGAVVFYRAGDDAGKQAVNISLDGEYLASLLPGGGSQSAVCARPLHITAIQTNKDEGYAFKGAQRGSVQPIQAGQTTYIRVSAADNAMPQLTVVDGETARQELKNIRWQTSTLPRVGRQANCN